MLRPRHQPPMLAPSGKCITICLLLGHPLLMGNGTRIVRFCHQADFVVNEYHGIGPPETDALFFCADFPCSLKIQVCRHRRSILTHASLASFWCVGVSVKPSCEPDFHRGHVPSPFLIPCGSHCERGCKSLQISHAILARQSKSVQIHSLRQCQALEFLSDDAS